MPTGTYFLIFWLASRRRRATNTRLLLPASRRSAKQSGRLHENRSPAISLTYMHPSLCAAPLCSLFVLMLAAATRAAPSPTVASSLRSLADLNAAVSRAPLLLVLFDPFSQKSSDNTSPPPALECSNTCQMLLSLCQGAAALPLPQRSRITCGLAQGDKQWMKA